MKVLAYLIFFLIISFNCIGQGQDIETWSTTEKSYYNTLKGLAQYINDNPSNISKDTLYNKYIYFDNVLNDTVLKRKNERIQKFDDLFQSIPKTIDSIGLENLGAKPLRLYPDSKWSPYFTKHRQESIKNIFVYFNKNNPDDLLGLLLLEPETYKLAAWIYLTQGETSGFFLTFNLL